MMIPKSINRNVIGKRSVTFLISGIDGNVVVCEVNAKYRNVIGKRSGTFLM